MLAATLMVIALMAIFVWKVFSSKSNRSVPSAEGLPFIGMLHKMDYFRTPQQLAEVGKNFKGIFSIGANNLVVDDKKLAMEILLKQDPIFANRNGGQQYVTVAAMGDDIGSADFGDKLQMMRKASFKALHLHGSGLLKLEAIVHEEVRAFLDVLQEKEGTDVAPKEIVYAAVTNTMASLLLGDKFSYDSEEVRTVHELDQKFNSVVSPIHTPELNKFPWLLHLPFARYINRKEDLEKFVQLRDSTLNTFVQNYKDSYDPNNIHCVLSSLFKSQETHGADVFTDTMISGIMLDLIIAGSLTTSTSITGLLFIMAHKQEIQERMFREIQEVVGDARLPCAEDRESLPYVNAVILELLRYQTIAAMNVPRVSTCDTEINGCLIPKHTVVLVNQWAIHHNAEEWEKPHEFYPEHFLDDQGHLLPVDVYKKRGFLPFGAGRRACLGETFAKNRLFLMVTAIAQRFKVLPPALSQLPEMTTAKFIFDSVNMAPDYEVRFVSRA